MPWPQVWPRRQEVPQQQVQTGLALIEGVERTNAVMACPQQRIGFAQCNSYAMDIDRRENRNCYNCRGFRYLARNCRNRENRIGEGRRLEYSGNKNNRQRRVEGENGPESLNGNRDLILLD